MEVSLRGSYGVQLQPVKRAALSHHCDIAGLVASGTPLSLSSRLFSCFVVTGTGHANLLKADKRRFHQGPRVMTLNFEAGYMHAVFPRATPRRFLAARAGSIYAPRKLVQSKCDH
jgi:hypothetical protein